MRTADVNAGNLRIADPNRQRLRELRRWTAQRIEADIALLGCTGTVARPSSGSGSGNGCGWPKLWQLGRTCRLWPQ